nr:Asp-tRNA(Asn)/Glu-tRNA(Gln) amidotransferase subunit GatC [Corynebacterium sp. c6VSa_13]
MHYYGPGSHPICEEGNSHVPDFSRDKVAHLANLARLALSDEELDQYATQIDGIIANVSAVQQVAAQGVEPMSHPHSITTTMRADVEEKTLTADQALDQAPEVEQQRFVVPQILGE